MNKKLAQKRTNESIKRHKNGLLYKKQWFKIGKKYKKGQMKTRELVSYNLKRLRLERNLTQFEFAELIGISQSSLNKYEIQARDVREANRELICSKLKIEEHELYRLPDSLSSQTKTSPSSYGQVLSILSNKLGHVPDVIFDLLELIESDNEVAWNSAKDYLVAVVEMETKNNVSEKMKAGLNIQDLTIQPPNKKKSS